ncbi:MAG: hypothetical protein A3H69_03170 [Candidatus Sungbacteria bacterium RIFCSPLOWO2_02_FULL_47_9]|uniref:CBS domain-containing protein n=1 Tax=Candidatus Sungbacteria bacterium RIFCSPHIGHO2_01_FULL_47_32 TaxID=1802264 RepID=A0A1G2K5T0_9BACT|nr:MAG: hypothetical protein UX72_C0043G0008 [Parcubacteria group bacterium GW2011_GWA2_47_10]OGZ93788.1 MAG: hypothetical protein A2633_04905 [Candidatus Sungbacteria bacterium RIFCSPHIGHO2_01_FULL_47_32]OGZ99643.1 MAG: hypothetical protein A3D57_04120 [Candidatus Sungbacteria bacterium RIFCSPHIGHO2_02_FULL_46_12]OHA05687.1 MAG: hypothetical protein A3A28_01435 [Candidatus Sungbacteria bacterium RIFCSPLOWO2_01_FULL_47_32]OHA10516.1 MAG: hypothetical protein A3H69_03170 [Candidatus Sungbacteria
MAQGSPISIKDIMTTEVISVFPDSSLLDAARTLSERQIDGLPVVDRVTNKLVGILTEYDLISKGSAIHLPTFQFILGNIAAFKKNRTQFEKQIAEVSALTVKDVMNTDPLTLPETASYDDAVFAFREHHRVNPIPVINAKKEVTGVISRFDILKPLHIVQGK